MRGEGATEAESARGGSGERSEADGKREGAPGGKVSGDDSWRAPPVPIPNTEVKPPNADGTELGTAWESRKLPGSTREREERKFFPLSNIRKSGAGAEAGRCAKPGREPRPSVKYWKLTSKPPGRQTSRTKDPE